MPVEGIIGKKLGMTQVYDAEGKMKAVTAIEVGPCVIAQVKSVATDGYNAAQLAFENTKKLSEPEGGCHACLLEHPRGVAICAGSGPGSPVMVQPTGRVACRGRPRQ